MSPPPLLLLCGRCCPSEVRTTVRSTEPRLLCGHRSLASFHFHIGALTGDALDDIRAALRGGTGELVLEVGSQARPPSAERIRGDGEEVFAASPRRWESGDEGGGEGEGSRHRHRPRHHLQLCRGMEERSSGGMS